MGLKKRSNALMNDLSIDSVIVWIVKLKRGYESRFKDCGEIRWKGE
jgi:hypothetical protein